MIRKETWGPLGGGVRQGEAKRKHLKSGWKTTEFQLEHLNLYILPDSGSQKCEHMCHGQKKLFLGMVIPTLIGDNWKSRTRENKTKYFC